ncbi:MAG: M42 family metallopeptidase [Spirochaetia bacterium]|jgi:endoglucanase
METASLVRELTEARGPSGYEAEVRDVIRKRFEEHAHEVRVDALGNCIALRRGSGNAPAGGARPSLMLAGHMDEIALMVAQREKGFLRIAQIGGFDPRVLFGQEVVVHGRRELAGLVVSVPPHFTDAAERDKPVPLEKLFVDVGLPAQEVETLVRVGDIVTLRARWTSLAGGYAACKSMDDRLAVAAIALCLEELSRRSHEWDVYAVATVQEEVGLRGAVTGAYGIAPTAAIAIDVTFGAQPGLSAAKTVKMDGGPGIALGPNFHPRLFERLVDAAKAIELSYQVDPIPGASGTDAWGIQMSRSGVPCGLVSIPLRSMHTPVETVCLRDVERAGRLLAEFICRLPASFAETLVLRDALAKEKT